MRRCEVKNAGNHAIDLMILAKQWGFQGFSHGDNKDPRHPPCCAPSNFVPFAFHWQFVVEFFFEVAIICQILNNVDVLTVPFLRPWWWTSNMFLNDFDLWRKFELWLRKIFMVNSTTVNFSNSGDTEIQLATPHHPLNHSTYQLFWLEFYSEDWRSSCKLTIHQKMGGTPLSSTIFWAGALADTWRKWHGHWSLCLCGKTNEIKQLTLRVQSKHPNVQKKIKIIQILNSGRGV